MPPRHEGDEGLKGVEQAGSMEIGVEIGVGVGVRIACEKFWRFLLCTGLLGVYVGNFDWYFRQSNSPLVGC